MSQIATVLAALAGTYEVPSTNGDRPKIVLNTPPKPAKVKAPKKKLKAEEAPAAPKPAIVMPSNLPSIGTYNGKSFLLALRDCGKRTTDEGRVYFDPTLVREDTIRAIAGYVGFDPNGDFGAQDLSARTRAQGELKPVVGKEYKRVMVASTIAGYVSGVPNETAKRAMDLEARARLAAAALAAYEVIKDHDGLVKAIREHFIGDVPPTAVLDAAKADASLVPAFAAEFAAVEAERLNQIHADLRALGF